MPADVPTRQLTQWALSAALVLGILAACWYSSKNRSGGDDSPIGPWPTAELRSAHEEEEPSDLEEEAPSEQRRREISSMPACVDLKRSLERLDGARDTLLREAAAGGAETAVQAVRDYQQSVQTVREGVQRLRSRLTPDEYQWFWASLASEREESRNADLSLPETQLGILAIRSTP